MLIIVILVSFSFFSQASIKDLVIPIFHAGLGISGEVEQFGIDDGWNGHSFKSNETFEQFSLRMKNDKKRILRTIKVRNREDDMIAICLIQSIDLTRMKSIDDLTIEEFDKRCDLDHSPIDTSNELSLFDKMFSFDGGIMALCFLIPSYEQKKINFSWISGYNFQDNLGNITTDALTFS